MNIVKELRKKMGIQQKELALAIGVAQPTISDWESNKKDPSGDRLKKLADYFGVDELVILGKGVVDLTKPASNEPRTPENPPLAERETLLRVPIYHFFDLLHCRFIEQSRVFRFFAG